MEGRTVGLPENFAVKLLLMCVDAFLSAEYACYYCNCREKNRRETDLSLLQRRIPRFQGDRRVLRSLLALPCVVKNIPLGRTPEALEGEVRHLIGV